MSVLEAAWWFFMGMWAAWLAIAAAAMWRELRWIRKATERRTRGNGNGL